MALPIARFVNLLAIAVLFAIVLGSRVILSPVVKKLGPVPYVTVQKGVVETLSKPMAVVMAMAVIAPIPVLVFLGEVGTVRFWLTIVGFFFVVAVTASTVLASVPLERQVATWNPKAPPANFFQVRDRWEQLHTLRTVFVSISMASQIAAVVIEP